MEDTQTFLNFCFQLNCLFQDSESSLKFLLLTFQVEVAGRGACSSVCGVGHVMRNTLKGMPLIGWLQLNRRQTFRLEFLVVANRVHLRVPVTTGKIPQQKKNPFVPADKKMRIARSHLSRGGPSLLRGALVSVFGTTVLSAWNTAGCVFDQLPQRVARVMRATPAGALFSPGASSSKSFAVEVITWPSQLIVPCVQRQAVNSPKRSRR